MSSADCRCKGEELLDPPIESLMSQSEARLEIVPASETSEGKCRVPQYNGNGATGATVDWTDTSNLDFSKTVKDTVCMLQKRIGVIDGTLCDD